MKNIPIIVIGLVLIIGCIVSYHMFHGPRYGNTSVTTINGSDTLSNSRPVINGNFSNLVSAVNDLLGVVATSSTATSTFAGNISVAGNLKVSGNFFSPVQLVSSGNATINGNLTTTNASTTNASASQSLFVSSKQVNPYHNATFGYGATSTAWAGTTTETTLVAPFAGTLQDVLCTTATTTPDTSVDTLNVQFFDNGTAVVPALVASTTQGTVTFTSGNTFVRGDTLQARFGSPVSSPKIISCTIRTTITSF